jgi:hypothetical protein
MSEDEIRRVFQNSVFGAQFDGKKQCPSPAVAVMCSEDRDMGNVFLKLLQRHVIQCTEKLKENPYAVDSQG